eukprot:gnl/MRDRNA2_/MRDRNA2_406889_c0_seq1.p1 gnl/MRDRNA2_/MRDRNA2_406889_c0~~gnl/MRDRNA2_/MRDRNA2_406889_c0_seq1.p1  ORF type:complete len:114 (+),score=7.43 gnl/MRDRNA2_/MRDRNA2_406889_c0_seq1:234-575(+)
MPTSRVTLTATDHTKLQRLRASNALYDMVCFEWNPKNAGGHSAWDTTKSHLMPASPSTIGMLAAKGIQWRAELFSDVWQRCHGLDYCGELTASELLRLHMAPEIEKHASKPTF